MRGRKWAKIAASFQKCLAAAERPSARFGDEMCPNEILVQRHSKSRTVRDFHPTVPRLHFLDREIMPQRRVLDAILKQERVAASAQPVSTSGNGDRAGVTMIAQSPADLLDAVPDVRGVRQPAPGRIDLINVERP